jgi:light-regulated signal transduction histidine kinase (bacteriophytochrome)
MVKASGESLLSVINDILDFSKIEAGKLAIDVVPFDLNDTVAATVRLLAMRAHVKGLELACDIRPDVPTSLLGDPGRLRQVITNLMGNAIKFTAHGEVVLTVEAETQTDDETTLRFSVSDTGIGIPLEQREAIFKPFVQADGSTTREYGGTELGWVSRFRRTSSRCWADGSGSRARPVRGARSALRSGSIFSTPRFQRRPPGRRRRKASETCRSSSSTTPPPTGASSRRCSNTGA